MGEAGGIYGARLSLAPFGGIALGKEKRRLLKSKYPLLPPLLIAPRSGYRMLSS
jgi:hypothetical protein